MNVDAPDWKSAVMDSSKTCLGGRLIVPQLRP
jgi:hypothetical protein